MSLLQNKHEDDGPTGRLTSGATGCIETPSNSSGNHSLNSKLKDGSLEDQEKLDQLVTQLRSVYLSHHLEWIEHCEAMDRLRLRLNRKKRPTLTPLSATIDLSVGLSTTESAGILGPTSTSAGIASLTAGGRTTRRTANFSTFGIGDAVTDAQFDLVLAQLDTVDQKDPNIRAMKTTAVVPDMALLAKDRRVNCSEDLESHSLVVDPISFYDLHPPQAEPSNSGSHERPINPSPLWTREEQEAFEMAYATQPKQFGWIANQVRTKSRGECVLHYYRTKCHRKYRNLHSPPLNTAEGKTRELRGRRSRRGPFNRPQIDTPTDSLKPKTKPIQDSIPTADELEDGSTPTEPSIAPSALTPKTAINIHSLSEELEQSGRNAQPVRVPSDPPQSDQRTGSDGNKLETPFNSFRGNLSAHSLVPPQTQDITDKTEIASPLGLNHESSIEQSNFPTAFIAPISNNRAIPSSAPQSRTQQVPPNPTSFASHSSKLDVESSNSTADSSKWTSRAHKKRRLHSVLTDSSSFPSKPVTSTGVTRPPNPNPSSTLKIPNPPDTASSSDLGRVDRPNEWNRSSAPQLNEASNHVAFPSLSPDISHSAQRPEVDTQESIPLPHATPCSIMNVGPPSNPESFSQPRNPTPVPSTRSSMQIKNLLNDDPVEPSVSLSNMDASTWFGNDSAESSPTQENPSIQAFNSTTDPPPPTNTQSTIQQVSLPPFRDHIHHPTILPRPLSQPLSQTSSHPLPRPLSRPLSRPQPSQSTLSQPLNSRLPPMSSHHIAQNPSEQAVPTDYHNRHVDGTVVDERFADPPSSPVSPSNGHLAIINPPPRGHQEIHLTHDPDKPTSTPTRRTLPHRSKQSFLVQEHSDVSDYYSPNPPIPSHHRLHSQTHMASQRHRSPPIHLPPPEHMQSHLASQVANANPTPQSHLRSPYAPPPQSAHPQGTSQFTSHASQRHLITSQLQSPTSARTSLPQFPSMHSPPSETHFNRLPPPQTNSSSRHPPETHHHPSNHYIWPPPVKVNTVNYSSSHPSVERGPSSTSWGHHPSAVRPHQHHNHPPNSQEHRLSSPSSTLLPPLTHLPHSHHQYEQQHRTSSTSRKQLD